MPAPAQPEPPLLPPLALAGALLTLAGAAALTNCAVLAAFLKRSSNGVFTFITQLVLADILLGVTLASELWYLNAGTWTFGASGCTAYQGFNVLSNTASLYLVTAVALHTLATINIESRAADRRIKKAGLDDDDEIRTSRRSLVASSDSSTPPRTMNVDYRLPNTIVPTLLPTVFVWVLATSLSVPEFVLSMTIPQGKSTILCTLDSSKEITIHILLAVFTLLLPMFILSVASVLIIVKLKATKRSSHVDSCDAAAGLKLSLRLIVVQVLLCGPRSLLRGYDSVYSSLSSEDDITVQVLSVSWNYINFGLASVCLITVLVRPVIYIITVPEVKKVFCFSYVNGGCQV